jgi:hypothetical protein
MSDIRKLAEQRLYEILSKVNDEETFCQFLSALSRDWYEEQEIESVSPSGPYAPGALGWENGTIGAFLDAASVAYTAAVKRPTPGRGPLT